MRMMRLCTNNLGFTFGFWGISFESLALKLFLRLQITLAMKSLHILWSVYV